MIRYLIAAFGIILIGSISATSYAQQNSGDTDNSHKERLKALNFDTAQVNLPDTQRVLILQGCKNTQSNISAMQSQTDIEVSKRFVTYSKVQKELKALELRILKQGADASEIDLLIGKLQQQLGQLEYASRDHRQITADLVKLDCKTEPELFKNGIVGLRAIRTDLLNAASDLKATINESSNVTFNPLIDRLTL